MGERLIVVRHSPGIDRERWVLPERWAPSMEGRWVDIGEAPAAASRLWLFRGEVSVLVEGTARTESGGDGRVAEVWEVREIAKGGI